jgi:DNA recombination protein RmuC
MDTLLIGLSAAALALMVILLCLFRGLSSRLRIDREEYERRQSERLTEIQLLQAEQQRMLADTVVASLQASQDSQKNAISQLSGEMARVLDLYRQSMQSDAQQMSTRLQQIRDSQEGRLDKLGETVDRRLDKVGSTVDKQLEKLSDRMDKRLGQMQETVDEKLHKTLEERIGQSFQLVNQRLEQVYKGLGEMQTLASGVGDLKKVLTNVKTRGVLGEYQLGAILEQILSPDQYAANVHTKEGSRESVEYAIKLPGAGDEAVWLPIDAKFPTESYNLLLDAYDSGDAQEVTAAAAVMEQRIRRFAKDIHDKYIDPPHTTDFAILFLPFEGLYAEAVRRGLVENLQTNYRVNIAGPTTLAALLNSLQMGFKTLAIQKRSGEVWQVLGAVRTEFDKFREVLEATQQRLDQANQELDKLVGVRTRQIQRRLKDVASLPEEEAHRLLEQGDDGQSDVEPALQMAEEG